MFVFFADVHKWNEMHVMQSRRGDRRQLCRIVHDF